MADKKTENKEALLLFLCENSLEELNEMILKPVNPIELKNWFMTIDEYVSVIEKAIQTAKLVRTDSVRTETYGILNESVLPMFFESGSVLFADSIYMDKDGLPSGLSLILRDKDGNETRQTYLRKWIPTPLNIGLKYPKNNG